MLACSYVALPTRNGGHLPSPLPPPPDNPVLIRPRRPRRRGVQDRLRILCQPERAPGGRRNAPRRRHARASHSHFDQFVVTGIVSYFRAAHLGRRRGVRPAGVRLARGQRLRRQQAPIPGLRKGAHRGALEERAALLPFHREGAAEAVPARQGAARVRQAQGDRSGQAWPPLLSSPHGRSQLLL